jgi:hypothetical protein
MINTIKLADAGKKNNFNKEVADGIEKKHHKEPKKQTEADNDAFRSCSN